MLCTLLLQALSNQVYRNLQSDKDFQGKVGLMTGDVTILPQDVACIVMTTEILRGLIYQ